jgi:hypothetical protein
MYNYATTDPDIRSNRLSAYAFNLGGGKGSGADWQPHVGSTGSQDVFKAGQWLHVVAEYRTDTTVYACDKESTYPGTIDIWVNGVKWNQSEHGQTGCMSQYSVTPTAASSPLNVATMELQTWFKGAIGKVAVYNKLLSQDQITSHYKAMTGKQPSGSCGDTCTLR